MNQTRTLGGGSVMRRRVKQTARYLSKQLVIFLGAKICSVQVFRFWNKPIFFKN